MRRNILIVDDQDDLATALSDAFDRAGHTVRVFENRSDALKEGRLDQYDLVITDLSVGTESLGSPTDSDVEAFCLPSSVKISAEGEQAKVFKFCASNLRRNFVSEDEIKHLIETVLNYKIRFVDTEEYVKNLHEKIEFEIPSAISPMHSILDYLLKRVDKLGVIDPDQANLFVALDEAFVNAVKHGNKFDTKKLVRITAEISQKEAIFTIEDEGDGFDVNAIPDPLDPDNLFKASGRGVLFIYNIMDEVKYNERGNRLTMVKRNPLPT